MIFETYPKANPNMILIAGPCLQAWTRFSTGLFLILIN